jgi:dynein heavy chain
MWVRAMVIYDRVAKIIQPKKLRLAEAQDELARVQAQIQTKQDALQEVLDRIAELRSTLPATEHRKDELEVVAQKTVSQLRRAEKLIGGLGGEKVRWLSSKKQLTEELNNLVGNMILAAGCLAYLGPFTSDFREVCVQSQHSSRF